jgi:hypothetical protein
MKGRPLKFAQIKSALLCASVIGLTGCVLKTIKVKMVDASTGQPIAGVTTLWRQDRYQMFETIAHSDLLREPASGPGGIIEIGGIYRNWNQTFVFFCPGYSNAYVAYSGTMTLADKLDCIPPFGFGDRFELDGRSEMKTVEDRALDRIDLILLTGEAQTIVKSNWCFIIPMQRRR